MSDTDNHVFETVDDFKYLESTVNSSNNISKEIRHRILLRNICILEVEQEIYEPTLEEVRYII